MPTAYSYTRFSSGKQKKGNSAERQGEKPEPWCESHGYTLNTTLRFHDKARSGFKGAHLKKGAQMWRFLEFVKAGTIEPGSALLIEHIDRLSRLPWQEGLDLLKEIINSGVDVVTLMDGQVYTKARLANEMGCIFMVMVHLCQANEASARKSDLSSDNWKRRRVKAADGQKITVRRPAWIKKDGSVDQGKADVIRRIFALACEGSGAKKIARTLNAEGVEPIGRAALFSTGIVQYYLSTRTVLGELQFKQVVKQKLVNVGESVIGYYIPIIDPKVFALASRRFHDRKRVKATGRIDEAPNLFVGLLRNLYDGSSYFYKGGSWTSGKSDKVYTTRRLVPFKGNMGSVGSMNIQLNYDAFENDFFIFCREIDLASVFTPGDKTKQQERLEERQSALIEIEERIRLAEGQLKTSKNKESWVKRIDEAEDERRVVLSEIEQLRSELTTSEGTVFSEMLQLFGDPTARVKIASHLRLLIDRIEILPIHTGTGPHRTTKYILYVNVLFANGQQRSFVSTDKGVKPPMDGESNPKASNEFVGHIGKMAMIFGAEGKSVQWGAWGYTFKGTDADRKEVIQRLIGFASDKWKSKLEAKFNA